MTFLNGRYLQFIEEKDACQNVPLLVGTIMSLIKEKNDETRDRKEFKNRILSRIRNSITEILKRPVKPGKNRQVLLPSSTSSQSPPGADRKVKIPANFVMKELMNDIAVLYMKLRVEVSLQLFFVKKDIYYLFLYYRT